MNKAISMLEELSRRWPGMMNIVRAVNGYETDSSYEDLLALNLEIEADHEGMEMLAIAMLQLMRDFQEGDPEVMEWCERNGFVSQKSKDLAAELREISAKLEGEFEDPKEFQAVVERLLEIQEVRSRAASKCANSLGRGFMGVQAILEEM